MLQKLTKIGLVCGGSGLLGIAVVLISGTAYPAPLFRALAPLSLLLICAALPPLAGAWVLTVCREWRSHNRIPAAIWIAAGLLLCLRALYRIL